jgi:hypothetical protein
VAAALGTSADQIAINDLAVNPQSKNVYLSVSRGLGPDALPVVLQVNSAGAIEELKLDNIKHASVALPNARIVHVRGAPVDTASTAGFADAERAAREADAVLLVVGERGDMSGEASSRASVELPGSQLALAQSYPAGPFTSGRTFDVPAFCRVAVTARPTADSDIKVEVWVPPADAWNGKLLGTDNGGFSGAINYAALAFGVFRIIGREAPHNALTLALTGIAMFCGIVWFVFYVVMDRY